jgi:LuxR family quorum-sensing system transcriptional regulator CciR
VTDAKGASQGSSSRTRIVARGFDINATLEDFLGCETADDLHEALACATHNLGFKRFAMGHHVDLVNAPENAMRITNYDPIWIQRALEHGYVSEDPVHHASTRSAAGFLWSRVPDLVRLTNRQRIIFDAAAEHGLCFGYTVPVHVPGEYRGTCSFGAPSDSNVHPKLLPMADLVGTYAFEAARQIIRKHSRHSECGSVPKLTDRQRDALVLLGRGKADAEIAILLGIAASTAHEHVENVRRAYGYAQRPNLIARALFDGQISYAEILTSGR